MSTSYLVGYLALGYLALDYRLRKLLGQIFSLVSIAPFPQTRLQVLPEAETLSLNLHMPNENTTTIRLN